MMRLTAYPADIRDAANVEKFCILFFERATYGDSPISAALELIVRFYLIPLLKNELSIRILLDQRFVDDLLSVSNDKDLLRDAIADLAVGLKKIGFLFKDDYISNFSWYDKNADKSMSAKTIVLSHHWLYNKDLILNAPQLHPHKKIRGKYEGETLDLCDVSQLTITKRLLSRLSGQLFTLDGTQLGILKCQFSIYFGLLCHECKTWDEPLTNQELIVEIKAFLNHLKTDLSKLNDS